MYDRTWQYFLIQLAMAFRDRFRRDVVVDMYCYRRHGHNEGDDPTFTQPLMYRSIRARKSVVDGYLDALLAELPDEPEGARQ